MLVFVLTCLARRSGTVLSSSVMHAMMASAFLILFSRRNMSSSLTLPAMPGKYTNVLVFVYVCVCAFVCILIVHVADVCVRVLVPSIWYVRLSISICSLSSRLFHAVSVKPSNIDSHIAALQSIHDSSPLVNFPIHSFFHFLFSLFTWNHLHHTLHATHLLH
jgi:hypothetical protein